MKNAHAVIFISALFCLSFTNLFSQENNNQQWIRINQLGYGTKSSKVAIWVSKNDELPSKFQLINAETKNTVYEGSVGKPFGSYGPFAQSLRLKFSQIKLQGNYIIKCGTATSPIFKIENSVYNGSADFALRYMRQQRSGYNPFLKDSCHTHDGYTIYGPMKDSTLIDVSGGWHDATDYLQYVTTSANATYHLLAAYRDFPHVFTDSMETNGLPGANGTADVLDEAQWGLTWLSKMHPQKDWMFNQLADDRDHKGFRLPNKDSVDYGMGPGMARPVYFASGTPQGLKKYKNHSTGVASTAGKFSSAFALAAQIIKGYSDSLFNLYQQKAFSAYQMGLDKPGVCQTAPCGAPYFYEEANWVDDMELAAANLYQLTKKPTYYNQAVGYSVQEKITPWLGADTASHYQYYPFHNFGHYEIAVKSYGKEKEELIGYYRQGIERVWKKASKNAFYRGIPFIWCSNNLTTSFAIQCYLYRKLSGDERYIALEESCFDWLFGCNPWGTSMVYGLPANGDTPGDPHSSLSLLNHYPLDGALVDGPVYNSIFKKHGMALSQADEYAQFQSELAVYHDDGNDYTSNEPTMDGTASLIYLLAEKEAEAQEKK